jgi:hypothetical protein
MAADALVGTWKLVSWQIIVDGRAHDTFGSRPKGFLILTPGGRLMVITTAENRSVGDNDHARSALHKSMLAYTGTYRVEGDEFITKVDVSWNESWNGTEQRRRFRVDGSRLVIESSPAPSPFFAGTIDFRRLVWELERG